MCILKSLRLYASCRCLAIQALEAVSVPIAQATTSNVYERTWLSLVSVSIVVFRSSNREKKLPWKHPSGSTVQVDAKMRGAGALRPTFTMQIPQKETGGRRGSTYR